MLGCANKNSDEWKQLLADANGDEDKAMESWIEKGYHKDANLNTESDDIKVDDGPKDPTSYMASRVKTFVETKLRSLKERKVTDQTRIENEYKRLQKAMEGDDAVKTISIFVEDAYNGMAKAAEQFDNLLKNTEGLSRSEITAKLVKFYSYAEGYSILDEISQKDIETYFNKPIVNSNKAFADRDSPYKIQEQGAFTMQNKIQLTKDRRELIKQRFLSEGIPLLADFLLEQKPEQMDTMRADKINAIHLDMYKTKNNSKISDKEKTKKLKRLSEELRKLQEFSLDKETLVNQLKFASKDESIIDFLFSPAISSTDAVLALFAKAIKTHLETGRLKDVELAREADELREEYNKEFGQYQNNFDKYFENILDEVHQIIAYDDEGNPIFVDKKALVQKYDIGKFNTAKKKFQAELGKRPEGGRELKEWRKKYGKWLSENTKPKSQETIDKIIKDKKEERKVGIITEQEYKTWLHSVISHYTPFDEIEKVPFLDKEGNYIYKGELTEPNNSYISNKWLKLYTPDNQPIGLKGKMHAFLLKTYTNAQDKLPEHTVRTLGYNLPSIPKGDIERALTNGTIDTLKNKAQEAITFKTYDTEYRRAGLIGEDFKQLPVYYTQNMDIKDVTSDALGSIMQFSAMANRYDALNGINGEVELLKAVVDARGTGQVTRDNIQILNSIGTKFGIKQPIIKEGQKLTTQHINMFIDMVLLGDTHEKEDIFGKDLGKITSTITGISAYTTLTIDVLKSVANNLQGNIQMIIESAGGEFFGVKNYIKGKASYATAIPGFLSEFGRISGKNFITQMFEEFDPLQGNYKDHYGRSITGSAARKLMNSNTLFFGMHAGEHEIAGTTLFALLDGNKTIDKETGKSITILDAYKKYGVKDIFIKTEFTEKQKRDLQNKVHALSKKMQGVYNSFDANIASKWSVGRLAQMYRKHLVPGYKRRFGSFQADYELGADVEGYYKTFWNAFSKDLRDYKFNIIKNWGSYTPFQKSQIKKVTAEIGLILSLYALITVLKGLTDDDKDEELKKNWMYNFMLYQAYRMKSETSQFISPADTYRVIKSPSAITGTLERAVKFTDQFIFTWNPDKLDFQRKTGVWNEGDNKSWAYFLKLMGYSGYNIDPSGAVQSFQSTFFNR